MHMASLWCGCCFSGRANHQRVFRFPVWAGSCKILQCMHGLSATGCSLKHCVCAVRRLLPRLLVPRWPQDCQQCECAAVVAECRTQSAAVCCSELGVTGTRWYGGSDSSCCVMSPERLRCVVGTQGVTGTCCLCLHHPALLALCRAAVCCVV
jgi:hypothetical protein